MEIVYEIGNKNLCIIKRNSKLALRNQICFIFRILRDICDLANRSAYSDDNIASMCN